MKRRGQGWTRQDGAHAIAIEERHPQGLVEAHVSGSADPIEKLERLRVAAKEHVLPVVHELAREAIAEGRRPAAKLRPSLEDENRSPGGGDGRRG